METLVSAILRFFMNHSFCEFLLTGVILPLFKGKGAKANNKDNYKGITLFPTLCKIYEMVLLSRLEKHAVDEGLFSDMQFGFKEGVGCTEASFTILDTINHMLERGSKVLGCFLDVRKAFDTVWIDGLPYKLFSEFGFKGRMWLLLKLCVRVSKHRLFTLAHFLENLMSQKKPARAEYLPSSFTKFTSTAYLPS